MIDINICDVKKEYRVAYYFEVMRYDDESCEVIEDIRVFGSTDLFQAVKRAQKYVEQNFDENCILSKGIRIWVDELLLLAASKD